MRLKYHIQALHYDIRVIQTKESWKWWGSGYISCTNWRDDKFVSIYSFSQKTSKERYWDL